MAISACMDDGTSFQSPLHRGVLFNVRSCTWPCQLEFHFSPLFIGESSLTIGYTYRGRCAFAFQSPLHRGVLFNMRTSGSRCRCSAFQSPLHRGVLFNENRRGLGHDARLFQSPLHRGVLFNARKHSTYAARTYFSPLFIGEVSLTAFYPLPFQQLAGNILPDFSQQPLFAEKPGRFAKTPIECGLEPNIRKYLRSSYGIRSPHSDSEPGLEEAKSHPESSHGFPLADPEFVF